MACGSAFAQMPGMTSHDMSIPPGHASIGLEEVCDAQYENLELHFPGGKRQSTLKDALHGIVLWPKQYIIIPDEEQSVPPTNPLSRLQSSPGRPSVPGSSSHQAHSPSPQPFHSGGASDDDDIPRPSSHEARSLSPPKQPPTKKQAPKRSRAQASKPVQPPKEKQVRKKKSEGPKRKLAYECTEDETEEICQRELDDFFSRMCAMVSKRRSSRGKTK